MPAGVAASSTYCMHRRILLPVVLAFLASLDVPGLLGIPIAPRFVDGVGRERADAAARSRSATCSSAAACAGPRHLRRSPPCCRLRCRKSEIAGCKLFRNDRRYAGLALQADRRQDRAHGRADGQRRRPGAGRLRRDAVLRRLCRNLPRQPPDRRDRQRQGRDADQLHHLRAGGVRHPDAHRRLLQREWHGGARRARRQELLRHAGSRRAVPRDERSTSSDRRNTKSSTARSAPASSRRRAGKSFRDRRRSTSTTTPCSRTRSSG